MSDELLNVEDDGPVPEPEAPAPVAETPEAPVAAAPEDAAAEVEAVEVGGQKYVPISAVKAERKLRQSLQERAARADQLEAYVNESRPYVEFLKNNPDLLKPRQQAPPAAPQQPVVDPEAESLARTLDLYTPEGQPDIKRATAIKTMMTQAARQEAQQLMAPIHEQSATERSNANFNIALTYTDPQGRKPSREALAAIWKTMSPQQTADPNVASILTLTALGMDYANNKPQPAAPTHAPLVTEGAGGAPALRSLSKLEAAIARDRGIKESAWQEHTKDFKPGRAQTLED